jgi:hypothetical protein
MNLAGLHERTVNAGKDLEGEARAMGALKVSELVNEQRRAFLTLGPAPRCTFERDGRGRCVLSGDWFNCQPCTKDRDRKGSSLDTYIHDSISTRA